MLDRGRRLTSANGNAEKSSDGGGHSHRQSPSERDPQRRTTERRATEITSKGAEGCQAHEGHGGDREDA